MRPFATELYNGWGSKGAKRNKGLSRYLGLRAEDSRVVTARFCERVGDFGGGLGLRAEGLGSLGF